MCFVITELSCRQSRVSIFQVQLANRATYLYDNRDPINQIHVFFFVFHFELTPFSDGQLPKASARPTVFNWTRKNIERGSAQRWYIQHVVVKTGNFRLHLV